MLFYTGANKHAAIQQTSSKSLGGWISSSPIPNNVLNNLFSSIDYTTIRDDLKSFRVMAFKNITGAVIEEFKIWTNTETDSFAKFNIGIILNAIDESCDLPYFEQLMSDQASPFYVTLSECETEDNALILTEIPINQYVGIFIERVLIEENNTDFGGAGKTCAEFLTEFIASSDEESTPIKKEDTVEIIISY